MELEDIKQYLRIEHEEDDNMLEVLNTRASMYIKNAVGNIDKQNELYHMAVIVLVGHWYDNRQVFQTGSNSYSVPHSFEAIIQQLRYCYSEEGDPT